MVDAKVSKTFNSDIVWVQVPSPVPTKIIMES